MRGDNSGMVRGGWVHGWGGTWEKPRCVDPFRPVLGGRGWRCGSDACSVVGSVIALANLVRGFRCRQAISGQGEMIVRSCAAPQIPVSHLGSPQVRRPQKRTGTAGDGKAAGTSSVPNVRRHERRPRLSPHPHRNVPPTNIPDPHGDVCHPMPLASLRELGVTPPSPTFQKGAQKPGTIFLSGRSRVTGAFRGLCPRQRRTWRGCRHVAELHRLDLTLAAD